MACAMSDIGRATSLCADVWDQRTAGLVDHQTGSELGLMRRRWQPAFQSPEDTSNTGSGPAVTEIEELFELQQSDHFIGT